MRHLCKYNSVFSVNTIQAVCGQFGWIVLSLRKLLISVIVVSPRLSSSKDQPGKETFEKISEIANYILESTSNLFNLLTSM